MRDYRKEQFINRFKNSNISRTEAERKYKLKIEEDKELERKRVFEAINSFIMHEVLQAGEGLGISGSGPTVPNWISVTDTSWLYPSADIEAAAATTSTPFTRYENRFIFNSISDVNSFYYDVWASTNSTFASGGYSMAVGTELTGSFNYIFLDLSDGTNIVTWQELTSITLQSSIPNSGAAPIGTVGYGAVRVDLDGDGIAGTITETTGLSIDPLRFIQI